MKLLPLATLALALGTNSSAAEQWELICENPRQEYQANYEDGTNTINILAPGASAEYRVLAVEKTNERHLVVATTTNNGPTARLHLRPYLKMELWTDGQLFQTDGCYRRNTQ